VNPTPGAIVAGRYEILERVAEGGMSTVYRARRTTDGVIVALKVLRDQYGQDREFVERFSREARAAQTLTHANIVRVLESGRDGDVNFIAMEYVEGEDLKVHLRRVGRMEPGDAERIALAVCDALDYAHGQGIVHRDIKPQNILLAADGTVRVADFGIARALSAVTITQTGTVLGTVQYLSPEQARGGGVGRASDIYALGVVLYEMLTGRLPFAGDSPIAIALMHLHDAPPSPRAIEPSVPRRLEGIVLKAMAKRSEHRYRSAREMAQDLAGLTNQWAEALADDDTTRMFDVPATGEGSSRRRRLVRLAVAVALAIATGLWTGWQVVSAYLNVPEVEMPRLVGRTATQAAEITRQAGLVLDVSERAYSPTVAADIVLAQDPPPGKRVKQGRRVGAVVSLGPQLVAVPDLVQRTLQEAQLALDSARLRLGALREAHDEVVKAGSVLRQDPPAGSRLPADSTVTLTISRGPAQVEMPALVGRTLAEARRLLDERGLIVTHVRTVASAEVEAGRVMEQTPSAGARVRPGQTTITITVSARPGEESAPPNAPVITAEPQPVESPRADPTPRVTPRPLPTRDAGSPAATPTPAPGGAPRRTKVQVVVPEGPGAQEVRIVVIDESGVRTIYRATHAPGERVEQTVATRGYTIIQVYIDQRLVQELRP
jgi:serine/threonine-protein kinase